MSFQSRTFDNFLVTTANPHSLFVEDVVILVGGEGAAVTAALAVSDTKNGFWQVSTTGSRAIILSSSRQSIVDILI